MTKPEAAPWGAWLKAAHAIGLSPSCFWRLSFREWRALVAPAFHHTLSRAEFEALRRSYPDHDHG